MPMRTLNILPLESSVKRGMAAATQLSEFIRNWPDAIVWGKEVSAVRDSPEFGTTLLFSQMAHLTSNSTAAVVYSTARRRQNVHPHPPILSNIFLPLELSTSIEGECTLGICCVMDHRLLGRGVTFSYTN